MSLHHSIQTGSDNQPVLYPVGTSEPSCEKLVTYLQVMQEGAITLVPHTFSSSEELYLIQEVSYLN
jgi:hypothetical protein